MADDETASIESALDEVEAALKTFGHAPNRGQRRLLFQTPFGTTLIAATRPAYDPRAPLVTGIPGVTVTVRTSVQPELEQMLGRMPAEINRFATLGALIRGDNGLLVASRASLFAEGGEQDPTPFLLAAAAIYGAESLCRAAAKAALADKSPQAGMPQESEWGPRDFETLKQQFEKSPRIESHLDSESFSVGFAVQGGQGEGTAGEVDALLQVFWNIPHLVCGAGLLIGFELMAGVGDRERLAALVEHLNRSELEPAHGFPHFGAWCPGRFEGSLGYVTFLPNGLKSFELEQKFINWALSRAELTVRWLAQSNVLS